MQIEFIFADSTARKGFKEQVRLAVSWLPDSINVGKDGSDKRVVITAVTLQKRKISGSRRGPDWTVVSQSSLVRDSSLNGKRLAPFTITFKYSYLGGSYVH